MRRVLEFEFSLINQQNGTLVMKDSNLPMSSLSGI